METLPNYRFEPGARVRRGDLAEMVTRTLALIGAQKPRIAERWKGAQLSIADLSPQHLAYPAVSQAVASGVMPLKPDGTFELLKPVTGAEAVEVVARLEALAEP
jgi:S-layer homology domain